VLAAVLVGAGFVLAGSDWVVRRRTGTGIGWAREVGAGMVFLGFAATILADADGAVKHLTGH